MPDGYRMLSRPLEEDEALTGITPEGEDPYREFEPEPNGNIEQTTPLIEVDRFEVDKSEISNETRPEIIRLLDLLDSELKRNGVKRLPARNQKNYDAIRLMLDRDGVSESDIQAAILWCQADSFWRGNILSAVKLREKYETLRSHAERPASPNRGGGAGFRSAAAADALLAAQEAQRAVGALP